MNRFRRLAVSIAMTGVLVLGGVVASTTAASAVTIASCSSQGEFAICAASGAASKPVIITVTVTASPNQIIGANWSVGCSIGYSSGTFIARTPVTRRMSLPSPRSDPCDASAYAELSGTGHIHVSIASSSTFPPLPAHVIRGYRGKCVNDPGNGSENGTWIALWSCDRAAVAQNWAFRSGQLQHNGKCAIDGRGAAVILDPCGMAPNDIWTHKPDGEYTLMAHGGTLCLTDPGFSTRNGTRLVVARCRDTASQRWTLP